MEQNEKLQEEKEDVQVKLAQINGKLQRYQNNEEQQGLSDESLTGNNSAGERSKVSPKLRFSTPLARHSICMELKDRLNEDKTLPSPFCEKLELSTDVNIINRRSVLLPTYMSAWDFEVSNGSLQDYSLELLKNRKSLSPSLYDADFEKKLNSLKDLEKDGLQKEIVKLYRANLDLAEKCHKSELNEVELREAFNTTNYKLEADRDKRQQLEESLESNRAAREVDLKDLWRLVHNPDEEDSTESEISLSSSAEYLKYQIRQEISALRNKLNIKEKALSALRLEKSKVHPSCKKRTTNSPLVEALNIDVVKSIKRQGISKGDKCSCECDNKVHTCNRSVPLMRKHSSEDNSDGQQFSHGDSLLDDQENLTSENSDANVDIIDNSEELDNMHRKDIPVRFRSDNSTGSECMLSNNSDTEGGVINNNHPKCQISKTGSGEKIQSNGNGEWQFIKDRDWGESEKGIEFKRPGTENAVVHKDKGHAMLRRQSYRKAIENPASSTDEMPTGRVRSDSFSNAIEEGQISPTSFSTTPVFSVSDTTPEYEGFESFSMTSAPRYFSTPLSIDTVKPVPIDRKTVCVNDNGTSCKDDESKPKIPTLQAQLFKAGGVNSNKLSHCSSNHLSILLEEEAHGDQSSLCSHSSPSGLTSPSESGNSKMDNSGQEKSQLSEYDFSAEIWTLSRSSENSTNTPSSCDSGHSSSITSFEKANRSPSEDNKMYHSNENRSTTADPASVESKEVNIDDTESKNKMGLTVTVTSPVKEDQDCSDTSQPPSPAICFFKIGSNGMKKNTDVVPTKQPVTNGLDKSQVLVPGEGQDGSGGEHHKHSSNLSKIRENHLAKRRDYIKQNKMPELSELSEKDSPDNNNEEKAETVIKTKDDTPSCEINGDVIMPSIPNEFLQKLGLTQDGKSSEELSDQEIESKFTSLSLAFKTDSQTLEKRLEIQERSRDIAEQNVDKELQGLRIGLETLNQICTDPQVREVLTKIQNHIDILEKSTARVSSRAEVFGAIQQEKRMSKAVDIMVHHVENIRRVHEREHAELEEARKLLQDSRSLAPSTIDLPGGEMLSRRSASVCQNSMFGGKASRRRVSEIALPKVLGGTGAATLHPSASMGNMHTAHITSESNSLNPNFEADARSRFQAVIASTTVKTAVANTLRRASLEKQNHVQHVTPANTPQVSRDNSSDSPNKHIDVQDKEKQKNLEEEAFKKGYEQGMRASLGQDLSSLREQQNNINESLGEIMDSIDNQIEEPKSLKELLTERFHEAVPKIKISGWRIRMTMGCFFIVMAVLSVIISLFPASSASLIDYRHYGRPPL
ncbi:uncharacterized protein LOC132732834 isoform X4 [Ruditapes philippinarum]|uniref:uncharacterized protein LOC132732834 isoform X4 n=1 Tax=Ruditapes philippinarum TaxID=129788 RepID=UPI00295B0942|nr:uncharacterized protein LOC132732834 isoform X4 [Ruditapes philippinarum]